MRRACVKPKSSAAVHDSLSPFLFHDAMYNNLCGLHAAWTRATYSMHACSSVVLFYLDRPQGTRRFVPSIPRFVLLFDLLASRNTFT